MRPFRNAICSVLGRMAFRLSQPAAERTLSLVTRTPPATGRPANGEAAGPATVSAPVQRIDGAATDSVDDVLAIEEPLEIRLGYISDGRRTHRSVSVTMRTPGHDLELAAGFLFTEGIVAHAADLESLKPCGRPDPAGRHNVVRAELKGDVAVDLARLERHFYTSSSCGVCGKTSIEAVQVCARRRITKGTPVIDAELFHHLPEKLRQAQSVFERTGGLHGAALFDTDGELLCVREDVGRHNAVDKLIGAQFLAAKIPLSQQILLLSGRASFELIQKAMMAGIPIVAAVGAPSSLAVQLARDSDMTLVGFLRAGRFNVYAGSERVRPPPPLPAAK